ncbi:MAG TPA: hypothetical protein VF411_06380 [Bacteroidia bacterium]
MKKKATKKTIAPKEIIASKKIIERNRVPAFLSRKYMQDCEASLIDFPDDKKVEFLEHLLECFDVIESYFASPTTANYKIYVNKENAFLKKHGTRLKMYRQLNMYRYYGDNTILVEKGIYTADEWNALGKEQKLNADEYAEFIDLYRSRLYLERDVFLLRQNPEDEREENLAGKNLHLAQEKTGRKRKITRDANDKMTCLSQEQTALLINLLQQERVFLKGNHLSAKEIGTALEILTGYSENTIRLSIGNISATHSIINLKEINKLLGRMKTTIEQTIKELSPKKPPLQEGS